MITGRVIAAVTAAAIAAVALAGTASAQYPTPKGSLVCATTVNSDTSSTISVTLRDMAGNPQADKDVEFDVTSGNGTLSATSAKTDAEGKASVELTGAENTSVSVTYDDLECKAVAQVLGSTFRPPTTGDAGLLGTTSNDSNSLLGLSLVAIGLSTGGALVLRHRQATVNNR